MAVNFVKLVASISIKYFMVHHSNILMIMTRNTSAFNHSMSKSFFYEYFQPLHDFLSEDLFEI